MSDDKIEENSSVKEEKNEEMEEEEAKNNKEKEQATQIIKEIEEKASLKAQIRNDNRMAINNRPDEDFFHKLDSNLRKNTAFVKKIGKLTEQQRTSLSNELKSLNLTRYIQEIASTLFQSKIKMLDIPCAVHICSLMHQRYADFTSILQQTAKKAFLGYQDDKNSMVANTNKLRTDLRFVSELTITGILSDKDGLTLLHGLLGCMTTHDKEKHELLSVIISICKHNGEDLAGLIPRKHKSLGSKFDLEIPKSQVFAADKQKHFYTLLCDYWQSVKEHLTSLHKSLLVIEKRNQSILLSKGELHDEKSKEYTDKHAVFTKLQFNANALADLLDVDMPDFSDNERSLIDSESNIICRDLSTLSGKVLNENSIWEDDDQKSFYTDLLALQAIIPAILFKDGNKYKKVLVTHKNNTPGKKSEKKPIGPKMGGKAESAVEALNKDLESLDLISSEKTEITSKIEVKPAGKIQQSEDTQSEDEKDVASFEDDTEEEELNMGATMKVIVEAYLISLKNCVNRDLVDKAAQDFCMNMNTRPNRKRLAKALFNVHRSRLDLLPFYARLAATLHPCIPDVSEQLANMLLKDFRYHMRKKEQMHIESKVKTMRFIGELTKFEMIPLTDCLNCLKLLINDFSPHTIEMACGLLETCGYYALRHPSSHFRARALLDQLIRKQTAKALDQRYSTMIDNARYTCDPPKIEAVVYKPRPPMHEYIRKLLFADLTKATVEKVLRQMRKLPWNEEDTSIYILKCLAQPWMVKFNCIHCLASLVAGLANHRSDVSHYIVDDVLEDIRIGIEIDNPKFNQRRVSTVKFLGELYNYRVVASSVIFHILYFFITYGVSYNHSIPGSYDPPDRLFRIRLACVLLETCGQYFDRGNSKRRLDYYIPYLQRYIWMKKTHPYWSFTPKQVSDSAPDSNVATTPRLFPVEIDFLVQDTFGALRPKLKLATSFEEVEQLVQQVDQEMKMKISKLLPTNKVHDFGETSSMLTDSPNLVSIPESNEEAEKSVDDVTAASADEDEEEGVGSDEETDQDTIEEENDRGDLFKSASSAPKPPKLVECAEDNEFVRAFDSIVIESLQSRKKAQVCNQDMSVPINARKKIMSRQGSDPANDSSLCFTLLTRKGNKAILQPLKIPVSEQFAIGLRDRNQAEEKQKQELKQITLSMNERQVEEEQHLLDTAYYTKQPSINMNRERRPKYQPPKGAPNADLIFNTGGRRR